MGIKERKEKERILKQDEILDAAEELFFSNGFDKTTMNDIADKAEFSKQTLYSYFTGKEQILGAIHLRASQLLNDNIGKYLTVNADLNGLKLLETIKKAFIEFSVNNSSYLRVFVSYRQSAHRQDGDDKVNQLLGVENQRLVNYFIKAIQKGVHDGSIDGEINPVTATLFIQTFITGVISAIVTNKKYVEENLKKDPSLLLDELFSFALRAFKG